MKNMDSSAQTAIAASKYTRERDYWLNRLSGDLDKFGFPHDYHRKSNERPMGEVKFRLNRDIFTRLSHLTNESHSMLFMVLTAELILLLYKYSYKAGTHSDILLGSPVYKQDTEGNFINTVLTLRNRLTGNMTFKELLLQVKQTIVEANENQNYPLETLLHKLNIPFQQDDDFPLFDIAILLENIHDKKYLQHINLNMIFSFCKTRDSLEGKVEYNSSLYSIKAIEKIVAHFNFLLQETLFEVDRQINEIIPFTREERKQLEELNNTKARYPKEKTIHQLFENQVTAAPDRTALAYRDQVLTYRVLNEKANHLAAILKKKGVKSDSMVGLLLPRSPGLIFGILGILKAGGAYLPIHRDYPEDRVMFMLSDSDTRILVTTPGLLNDNGNTVLKTWKGETVFIDDGGVIPPVNSPNPASGNFHAHPNPVRSGNTAYLIYTSGSTGKPKGVMVEHRGLVNYTWWAARNYIKNKHMSIPCNFPLYSSISFDLTVTSLFTPLITGNVIVIYQEGESVVIIDKIIDHNITDVIKLTPSHLKLIKEKKLSGSSSNAKILIVGGEVLESSLASDISKNFQGNIEIYNEYGPTETVVGCMIYRYNPAVDTRETVPIGVPAANTRIYILDAAQIPLPPGAVGEICVSGAGTARGYLNRPELTMEKFVKDPFQPGKPIWMYKTGDLGRRLPDGNIEFLGRSDDQVKIRGFRIEPGEIENLISAYDKIKEAVVVVKESSKRGSTNKDREDRYLCAFFTAPDPIDQKDLSDYLSQKIPAYMIPTYFIQKEKMPLTINGKINRKQLETEDIKIYTGDRFTPPRNKLEELLVNIWAECLGHEPRVIGIDSNFFNLGGHSLKAITLISRLHKEFKVQINLDEIFTDFTIRKMATLISGAGHTPFFDIQRLEEKEYYIPSYNQKRIWFLNQMDPGTSSLNMPSSIMLRHEAQEEIIKKTIKKIIERHESFRTGFKIVGDELVQFILEETTIPLKIIDISSTPKNRKQEKRDRVYTRMALEPFDLSQLPIFRTILLKWKHGKYEFMFNLHHIITDGWSMQVLRKDFLRIYNNYRKGEDHPLKPQYLQYRDFAGWHNWQLKDLAIKENSHAFWKTKLEAGLSPLQLPGDFRHSRDDRKGAGYVVWLDMEKKKRLYTLAKKNNTTLFVVMFSLYILLLNLFSHREEILCSIIGAGRGHLDLQEMIGFFLNPIVYKTRVNREKPFSDFLGEVNVEILETFMHQTYPLELVCEELGIRYPDLSVSFNMLNMQEATESMELDAFVSHHTKEAQEVRFDIEPYVTDFKNGINIHCLYKKHLFFPSTIEYLMEEYIRIIDYFTLDPLKSLNDYREREKNQVVKKRKRKRKEGKKTLVGVFEEAVCQNPDKIAVKSGSQWITYTELNRYANRIAFMIEKTCLPQDSTQSPKKTGTVLLFLHHGLPMIAAILGTLKAGKTYIPVSIDYPDNRISFMLSHGESSLILTASEHRERAEKLAQVKGAYVVEIDRIDENIPHENGNREIQGGDIAYIMYTSGSTGMPKGVAQTHQNARYYTNTWIRWFSISPSDRMTLFSSFCHDGSVQDMFGALHNGATLYPYDIRNQRENSQLSEFLIKEKITIWHSVPTLYNYFTSTLTGKDKFPDLRIILLGGEPLRQHEINALKKFFPGLKLANVYGQTESSLSSMHLISPQNHLYAMLIGEPPQETDVYVIDENYQPVAPFETGEIIVVSDYISPGYWKDIKATQKTFIHHEMLGRFYKTGDLGRQLPGGNIEFVGRKDFQVKIRGYRVELGEIETQLQQHIKIEKAVVIARKTGDGSDTGTVIEENQLAAYFTIPDLTEVKPDTAELREYLAQMLPDYMIPTTFFMVGSFPLTASGKIDRKALSGIDAIEIVSEVEYTPPGNRIEEKLVEIWSQVLKVNKDSIGIDHNFFDLGGHSLNAIIVTAKIHRYLNVKIPIAEIFRTPRIKALARYIRGAEKEMYTSIEPVEEKEYYTLSPAQKRMFILWEMNKESKVYNQPKVVVLHGSLDREKLANISIKIMERHEILRTSFEIINGEPFQKINKPGDVISPVEYREINEKEAKGILGDFMKPFDLSKVPLFRIVLLKIAYKKHLLMLDLHHIISDGTSNDIFIRELRELNAGRKLPGLKVQYKDYSQWQSTGEGKSAVMNQEKYWLEVFQGKIPQVNFPYDFPRPEGAAFEGDKIKSLIGREDTEKLAKLAKKQDATLFMVLFAIFNIFLAKLSGQEDIIVGTPVLGRRHAQLEDMIGMFVNMLALRNYPRGNKTFISFIRDLKERTIDAFDNQDFQFEDLVAGLKIAREETRNPIFDIVFSYRTRDIPAPGMPRKKVPAMRLENYEYTANNAHFDLTLTCREVGNGLLLEFEYRTKLFKRETIEKFSGYFKKIVSLVVDRPGEKISGIAVMKEEEKQKLFEKIRAEKGMLPINKKEKNQDEVKSIEVIFDY